MIKGEDSVDPIQGEFFASEEIGDLSEILVREAIQNSLDARLDKDGTAEVVISYKTSNVKYSDLIAEGMPLHGLNPHLKAENSGLRREKLPKGTEVLDYIVAEDFGTKGLNGDPEYDDDETPIPADSKEFYDFFYFWRNIGRSGKKDGLGSWGLGKHVFPAASRINTYFGLTNRSEDGRKLLMGKSILKIHHHNRQKYAPYGYFGEIKGDGFFAVPFEASEQLDQFENIFDITRAEQSGLSVVIPFPKPELMAPGPLVESVLKDYFYPVIRGRLKVYLRYDGCDEIIITNNTIKEVAQQYLSGDEMLLKTIDLAIWSSEVPEEDIFVLEDPDLYKIPSLSGINLTDDMLSDIRGSLELNGKVLIRVPVRVKTKEGSPARGEFDVCFTQTDVANRIPAKYIRQGIDVKNANKNSKLDAGCIALVEIHDKLLGKLLRVSEPPAHDRWEQRNNEDLLELYDRGEKSIGFVKKAPHDIWRKISKKNIEQNRDLLRDIFHLDLSALPAGSKKKPGPKKKPEINPPPADPPEPKTRMIRTYKSENGFTVTRDRSATHTPKTITINVAYRVPSGNHLRKYSPLDFRLNKNPIDIEHSGIELVKCLDNILLVNVTDPEFEIKVTGFDINRDLVVQVVPAKEDEDDQEI
ncbi:hypothetical protein [Pontiella agarivorans]|uniref:Uncharacterized protein n=1 Tax=Pontiella agarivorans TaxID=3038953 RepID=A0ABU5MVG4_9BACT|nr:hypothetical protein [Pontiella agarivorans]MDZ8118205.1 hypothetical protein [Pontiella agarivorans]